MHNTASISYNSSHKKLLIIFFWIAGIAMGAWQAWEARHHMSADGISYLDMADAYMRGDWKTAINAYWSPLYSWLLGLALLVFQPSPYNEFTVVHMVSYVIFLFTLGCFHFFIMQLVNYHRQRQDYAIENNSVTFPEWAFIAIGYSLFLQSSLNSEAGVWEESPDMCVAALVYLASGIILRLRNGAADYRTYALLGVTLGFGYLAKAVMFPLSFIFISLSAFSIGNFRKALPRTLIALVIFLIISGPFIIALSKSKGRITFGDSGKYSYWFHVNAYFDYHWDGDPPGSGTPRHPPRKILDLPEIYEFATPLDVSYPLWYDPSYWNDGLKSHFNLKQQLQAFKRNFKLYYVIFYPTYAVLFFGSLLLYLVGRRRWMAVTDIAEQWSLLIPAAAALTMYSIINVDIRYVAAFIPLLWLGILSSIHLPDSEESKRLLRNVTLVVVLVMTIVTTRDVITHNKMLNVQSPSSHVQWQIADALNNMGVLPGDKVASIGFSHAHFWARIARVSIVAEISHKNADDFWSANESVHSKALKAFSMTGAKAIVTNIMPHNLNPVGWQRITGTDHYVYMLKR